MISWSVYKRLLGAFLLSISIADLVRSLVKILRTCWAKGCCVGSAYRRIINGHLSRVMLFVTGRSMIRVFLYGHMRLIPSGQMHRTNVCAYCGR